MPKVRDVLRRLRDDGWEQVKSKGGHRNFKHPAKRGRVTVPGHPNDDLTPGTWGSIQRQAGWKDEEKPEGREP
jgi:predicted RNA binding protein YcfA (HicA-like mRNA interferase family)